MFEWILVLTLSTGAGGGVAIDTVGVFQSDRECSSAGSVWLTQTHAAIPSNKGGVRDYVCLKRTKPDTSDPQGIRSEPKQ